VSIPKRPSKVWRVTSPDAMSVETRTQTAAYEWVAKLTQQEQISATVYHWDNGWKLYERVEALPHGAAVPGHVRETTTPGEHLDPPQPSILLADCSCGAEYEVPQGGDEYGALEQAHRAHVTSAREA
jgi:hypothetical protein